jgi:antitoxin component YwqK of YwqJK toxin-antitoxin module
MLLNYKNFRALYESAKEATPEYKYYPNGQVERESWYLDGKKHRVDGPAVINYDKNGQVEIESWYLDGKKHREDGPTVIWYDKNGQVKRESWYLDGKRHRVDGPAVINYYPNGQVEGESWYLDDTEIISRTEFWQKTPLSPEKIRELLDSDQLNYEEKAALSQNPNFKDEQDDWLFGGW